MPTEPLNDRALPTSNHPSGVFQRTRAATFTRSGPHQCRFLIRKFDRRGGPDRAADAMRPEAAALPAGCRAAVPKRPPAGRGPAAPARRWLSPAARPRPSHHSATPRRPVPAPPTGPPHRAIRAVPGVVRMLVDRLPGDDLQPALAALPLLWHQPFGRRTATYHPLRVGLHAHPQHLRRQQSAGARTPPRCAGSARAPTTAPPPGRAPYEPGRSAGRSPPRLFV